MADRTPRNARDVAGRGDHAAPPAADDQRFRGQLGIVALFDAGIEGITVHMGDRQVKEFGMRRDPRAAAGRAARTGVKLCQAIAAKGGHRSKPSEFGFGLECNQSGRGKTAISLLSKGARCRARRISRRLPPASSSHGRKSRRSRQPASSSRIARAAAAGSGAAQTGRPTTM